MAIISYLILGICAGLISGLFGLGGGAVLVPSLVLFFGMTQHQAQGTTLAIMLPPVFFFAAWRYFHEGHVNVPLAIYAAIGLLLGAMIGAHFAQGIPDANLKKAFGIFLMLVGLKMAFLK